jgi:hypothetical protein
VIDARTLSVLERIMDALCDGDYSLAFELLDEILIDARRDQAGPAANGSLRVV